MDAQNYKKITRKPRKIMKITPTKYDMYEAIHANKKHWRDVFKTIDESPDAAINESQILAKTLPAHLYKQVCSALNIPLAPHEEPVAERFSDSRIEHRAIKEPLLSFRKCLHINRELDSDTDVEHDPSDDDEEPNIHQILLSKPLREQITWATRYLGPEREDEKSLVKRADDLTDRIANEFCEYMKQLGGDENSKLLTPKAIKELFQIEFDTHVARGLRVISKELPSVDEKIANVTGNPDKSRYSALNREITRDIRAEHQPGRVKAFGQSLPRQAQYHAPRNDTKELWRSAKHVPRDLVTLKTVWEGITNLRSVKEYCRWMIAHPEHRRPPYLKSLGMFDPPVLDTRLTFEAYHHSPPRASLHELPTPID